MLNQNESKKWHFWKYAIVFPALIAFVFLFQIKVVAQEKEIPKQENETKSESVNLKSFDIDKDLTNLSKDKDIYINGEKSTQEELDKLNPDDIEKIDVAKINNKKAILITPKRLIKPVKITDKTIYIDGIKSTNEDFNKLDQNTVDKVDVNTFENTIRITTKSSNKSKQEETKNKNNPDYISLSGPVTLPPIIIINGNKTNSISNINQINPDAIKNMNVLKGKNAIEKYGDAGKHGVIEINTKTDDSSKILKTPENNNNDWITTYDIFNENNIKNKIIENNIINYKKAVIVINGKQRDYQTLEKLDTNEIEFAMQADIKKASEENQNKAIQLYGKKALNGFIQINTKVNTKRGFQILQE